MAKQGKKEVMKAEPSGPISVHDEMERWFEDFFRRPFGFMPSRWLGTRRWGIEEFNPSIDVYTKDGDVIVKAEMPGMKKEDIDVNISGDTLTVSGEKKKEEKVDKKDYYRYESSHGSFSRSFTLPSEVQTDKAQAKFKDGVLEIRIPKTEEAKKQEKKITVQ